MKNISKDSLWKAFERYNHCDLHNHEECDILNNLYNMALAIERGSSVEEAYEEMREVSPIDTNTK